MQFATCAMIAFEGPDGTGKTTLLNQVAAKLRSLSVSVEVVDYRTSKTGRAAYELARNHEGNEMTRRYLMAAAAEEARETIYEHWTRSLILLDRLHPISDWCYSYDALEFHERDRWRQLSDSQGWFRPGTELTFLLRFRHRAPTHALERRPVDECYRDLPMLRRLAGGEEKNQIVVLTDEVAVPEDALLIAAIDAIKNRGLIWE